MVKTIDKQQLQRKTATQGTKWHFNPPAAPHHGGAHKALVKSAKRALYAILANQVVTDEELMTAATGAEAPVNSRPLSYHSSDVRDAQPLTPNHFLMGHLGAPFVPEGVDELQTDPRRRWWVVQEIVGQFWRRWMKEVVPEMNRRRKWQQARPDMKVDDVVLVVKQDAPRGDWPIGKITEIFLGGDGHVRVAKVKVGQRYAIRPITRLCRLESAE